VSEETKHSHFFAKLRCSVENKDAILFYVCKLPINTMQIFSCYCKIFRVLFFRDTIYSTI